MSTILIAYEREMEQIALEKLLVERGHAVLRANNGVDALDAARRESPQLIVSDILLPKMDGFALLKKWKQDDHLQGIPFMFYTRRFDDPKYERFALELGIDRFVERSTDPQALYQAVDELLAEGAVARHADTQRLKAISTGSFTITERMALVKAANGKAEVKPVDNQTTEPGTPNAPAKKPAAPTKPHLVHSAPGPVVEKPVETHGEPADDDAAPDRSLAREARLLARVTELDALNKQLQASERRFRQLFESSPVPMWVSHDDGGPCSAVNQSALTLFGYTRDEFLALPRSASPLAAGAPIPNTQAVWQRTKSGAAIAVELSARTVELGMRRGQIVAAHDVTQRIFAQQSAAHVAESYQTLLVAAADGIWVLDDKQQLLDVNEAYSRMSGYTREELLRLAPTNLEMRIQAESTVRLFQHHAHSGSDLSVYETMHRRKDGSLYPVEVSVGIVTGARMRTVAIVRDTGAKHAALQLEQQQVRAQAAALELFDQSQDMDEAALQRRAAELIASVTVSPLAFVAATHDSTALVLTAVYEQSRGIAVSISGDGRKLSPQGPSAQCLHANQPLSIDDAGHGESAGEASSALPTQKTLLLMPVGEDREQLGVVAVANRAAKYSAHDQRLVAPIAKMLASLLRTKREQATTLVTAQRADLALQGIIEGLSRVVERHDPYTPGDPRRVAALAVAIARELDLSQAQQSTLRTAGLLHRVGNIAVPTSLLAKPDTLTPTELALVHTHAEEGRKILSEIEFGSPVSEIVYQHHERMDGSGYPQGLRGDAIRVEARILAVAEVVVAMCTPRPHRAAPGIDAALAELEQGAGRLYDERVCKVCARLFRESGFRLPE